MNKFHTFDINYFDVINTHNKAYIVGFILADGNVYCKNRDNKVEIKVSIKDKSILEFIKKELKATQEIKNKITKINDKEYVLCKIQICSKYLVNPLIKIGIHPNKTKLSIIPNIPSQFKNSFLLGYFDGDGCVGCYGKRQQPYIGFVSYTKTFLEKIRKFCKLNHIGNILQSGKYYRWRIGARKQCINMYNYMYGNTDFYLDRKYKKFLKFVNEI